MGSAKTKYTRYPLFCRVFLLVSLVGSGFVQTSDAQSAPATRDVRIEIILDGSISSRDQVVPADSVGAAIGEVIEHLRAIGFHGARLDSLVETSDLRVVYITQGPQARVRSITLVGATETESDDPSGFLTLSPGSVLDVSVIEQDARRILQYYTEKGHHLATVSIKKLVPEDGDSLLYDLSINVVKGPVVPVTGMEIAGAERTRTSFAARAIGLRLNSIANEADFEYFSDRLRETGAFLEVGEPILEILRDSTAVLVIPVEEAPPGTFDLVLGYLPSLGAARKAGIIGSGNLSLLNPFGYGRSFGLRLDRRPGQVSSVDIRVRDPQLATLPIRAEAAFSGLQQDSTFNRRHWSVDVGYGILPGVEIAARYTIVVTRPGSVGLRLQGERQRIPRSDAGFWGLVLRIMKVDSPQNPRSGITLESVFEDGTEKARFKEIQVAGDTTRIVRDSRQERLQLAARGYLPVFRNQTLVIGADAMVLLSPSIDESDLFRFGGAETLRGYDEDQFRASTALRFLVEYRLLIDRVSNAFSFFDLGYVETPSLDDIPAKTAWYPGFGVGLQFQSALGVVSVSYALNNRDGLTNGRIHMGVSFGL